MLFNDNIRYVMYYSACPYGVAEFAPFRRFGAPLMGDTADHCFFSEINILLRLYSRVCQHTQLNMYILKYLNGNKVLRAKILTQKCFTKKNFDRFNYDALPFVLRSTHVV